MPPQKLGLKRKFMNQQKVGVANSGKPRHCSSFFLDSGAHSLFNDQVLNTEHETAFRHSYYADPKTGRFTKEFRAYLDAYALFVQRYKAGMDFYVTVDAIYNPEISWKSLKYLEQKHGLNPVPVIHGRTPLKWLDKHLEAGYQYIGLGGMGQEDTWETYKVWADAVFTRLCPASNGYKPIVKTHGFAATAYQMLIRWPWYSVDSSSWAKGSGFGGSVYIPHRRKGQWDFSVKPYTLPFSFRSSAASRTKAHFLTMSKAEQAVILLWLNEVGVPLGSLDEQGQMKEYGVFSTYHAAATANVRFFNRLCEWLPEWPWAVVPPAKKNRLLEHQ